LNALLRGGRDQLEEMAHWGHAFEGCLGPGSFLLFIFASWPS
jgi:hypothetical protein